MIFVKTDQRLEKL